jgi:hypothetical protein
MVFNRTLLFYLQAENKHDLQKAPYGQEARFTQEMDRIHQEAMKESKLR